MAHFPKSSLLEVGYLLCGSRIQPKKQFKVQIMGILEEIDSFLLTKNALMKRCQKIWAGPSPPFIWKKSKRTAAFVRETFLSVGGKSGA